MDGSPELIIFLVFIAFSILDGVGRKKKAMRKKAEEDAQSSQMGQLADVEQEYSTLRHTPHSTSRPDSQPVPVEAAVAKPDEADGAPSGGAEGLIPKDVWQEILELARGDAPKASEEQDPTPEPAPEEERYALRSRAPREIVSREIPPRDGSVVPVSPSEVAPPEVAKPAHRPAAVPAASTQPEPSPNFRESLFGGGDPEELKKAFILKEVLDPPLALRE